MLLLLQYPHHPLAMYQVSGEYAMFWHASKAGAINLRSVLMETLEGMRRAGMCCGILSISQSQYNLYSGLSTIDYSTAGSTVQG